MDLLSFDPGLIKELVIWPYDLCSVCELNPEVYDVAPTTHQRYFPRFVIRFDNIMCSNVCRFPNCVTSRMH